ncbi:variable large family protein [Borrelia hispanica]|uniref:variable large family protein n=1 Tax=Borrelia hispanica TaxID=40835 RepID=UPI0004645C8C|nr:variable large family protein [Borrelia hispanica]
MRKPLSLLVITTFLFNGCYLDDKFIVEGKDIFRGKGALIFNSVTNSILGDQKVQLPQEKDKIDSNVNSQDDYLASGWYKVSGFFGGLFLEGAQGEASSVSNLNGFAGGGLMRGIEQESNNFSVDFSEDFLSGMSGQNSSLISEEEYYSNNIYLLEDSYNSISGLSGQNSSSLVDEEDFDIEINPNDNRGKIKEYFGQLKNKLVTFNKGVNSASIDKMIAAVGKLADATGDNNIGIGEISDSSTKSSVISDRKSVQDMIVGIKTIIEIAEESGVKLYENKDIFDDIPVIASSNTTAIAVLNGGSGKSFNDGGVGVGAGSALVTEVNKANAWSMLDKIKNAKIASGIISEKDSNDAGELITGYTSDDKGASAKSNADLAAAVALKAMSKSGKFAAYKGAYNNNDDIAKVQEAAVNAVKKVLNVLDSIITQTLQRISK